MNAIGNTKREFPDNEQQTFRCVNSDLEAKAMIFSLVLLLTYYYKYLLTFFYKNHTNYIF